MAKSLRAVWLILVTLGMTGGMNHRLRAQTPAGPRYDVTPVTYPGVAFDLNNNGQVLVRFDPGGDLFLWTPTTLDWLPGTATLHEPLRMNDLGDDRPWIAGRVCSSPLECHASRWSPEGGLVPVPSPFPAHDDLGVYYVNPGSFYGSASYGINNNGDIALTAVGGDYGYGGIVWAASGNLTLPYYTWLTGINDSGQAIGKNYHPGPPYVNTGRWPLAINDSGIVVGWDLDANPNGQVFRWSLANGIENLSTPSGYFPGGGGLPLGTPTMDINATGNIIATTQGNYQVGPYVYGERTFLYYQDGVCEFQQPPAGEPSPCWRPLDDLVVTPLHIRNTLAINDRGQILVEGEASAYYLLTPAAPAPSNHPPVVHIVGTLSPTVPLAPGPFSFSVGETPVTLFADATDPDGDPLIFAWQLISGTGVLSDPLNVAYSTYTNNTGPTEALVRVTVTDSQGASASAETTITVTQPPDRTPPVIDDLQPSSLVLWPPNHKMIPVLLKVSAHDDRDPAPTCSIAGITSNEPANGLGDGDTAPDAVQTGPLSVQLRAERAGAGTGRVYSVSIRCSDAASNSSERTVRMTVPHDQRK